MLLALAYSISYFRFAVVYMPESLPNEHSSGRVGTSMGKLS